MEHLKIENEELKLNGVKKKKKKRKKKNKPEADMKKLVDIMKDMNQQIAKLAQAVTETVNSSEEEMINDDHN